MPTIAANLVLPISRPGDDIEECLDPTGGGELTRRGNREAFDLYAERLTQAAAIVRRVSKAIDGRWVEVAEDEHAIGLTGPAEVLQPHIDAGDLELVTPGYYDPARSRWASWPTSARGSALSSSPPSMRSTTADPPTMSR